MSQLSVHPNKNVPFNVLAESNGYLAVEKPAGVSTQPGIKHSHDTLLNGLFAQYGHELQNLGKKRTLDFFTGWIWREWCLVGWTKVDA